MVKGRGTAGRWYVKTVGVVVFTLLILTSGLVTVNAGTVRRAALVAHASQEGWTRGNPQARITILVFSDFECPFCAQLELVLSQLLTKYPDDCRVVFRNFPLPQHALAMVASRAAEAAGEQGRFWEMHDMIFDHQRELNARDIEAFAEQIGLDVSRFDVAMNAPESLDAVMGDIEEAKNLKINAVPAVFLNSRQLEGPMTSKRLDESIQMELRRSR